MKKKLVSFVIILSSLFLLIAFQNCGQFKQIDIDNQNNLVLKTTAVVDCSSFDIICEPGLFDCTNELVDFNIPAECPNLQIKAWGGGGGQGNLTCDIQGNGGGGGFVSAHFYFLPETNVLRLRVSAARNFEGVTGGEASFVQDITGGALRQLFLVAGGGGAAGCGYTSAPGKRRIR